MRTIILTAITLFAFAFSTYGQSATAKSVAPGAINPVAVKPAEAKSVKPEDLLKFSRLQYEQTKRVAKMQELRADFVKQEAESAALVQQMGEWIQTQAKALSIDLKSFYFDFDQLKFVERPKESAPAKP